MKICPTCRLQFADDQTFCLHDGTVLVNQWQYEQEEPTVLRAVPGAGPQNTRANGPGKAFLFGVLGVIAVALLLGLGYLLATRGNNESADANLELKRRELDLRQKELDQKMQGQTNSNLEIANKPLPPVQPVNNPNAQRYSGNIGNSTAVFDLVWKKDRTVSGTYYYSNSPSQIYSVSGNNYRDGELLLNDEARGASIKMYKTLTSGRVCWSGQYYANNGSSPLSFCRYR